MVFGDLRKYVLLFWMHIVDWMNVTINCSEHGFSHCHGPQNKSNLFSHLSLWPQIQLYIENYDLPFPMLLLGDTVNVDIWIEPPLCRLISLGIKSCFLLFIFFLLLIFFVYLLPSTSTESCDNIWLNETYLNILT